MENPIINNRIVNDKTFAIRLRNFVEKYNAEEGLDEYEKEYLLKVANKLIDYQVETVTSKEETEYLTISNIPIQILASGNKTKLPKLLKLSDSLVEKLLWLGCKNPSMPDSLLRFVKENSCWFVPFLNERGRYSAVVMFCYEEPKTCKIDFDTLDEAVEWSMEQVVKNCLEIYHFPTEILNQLIYYGYPSNLCTISEVKNFLEKNKKIKIETFYIVGGYFYVVADTEEDRILLTGDELYESRESALEKGIFYAIDYDHDRRSVGDTEKKD